MGSLLATALAPLIVSNATIYPFPDIGDFTQCGERASSRAPGAAAISDVAVRARREGACGALIRETAGRRERPQIALEEGPACP